MRQKSVLALIFAVAVLLSLIVFSLENQPHAFKECSSCHLAAEPSGATAREMTGPVSLLCAVCHEKTLAEGYMHPVDIKPAGVIIPDDMPLSRAGEIMCATCHDVHSDFFTPYGAPTHFLRRQEAGKAFCRLCHRDIATGHTASLGEAHFRSGYIVTDPSGEIDAMSFNCLSCHDGVYAKSVTIGAGVWKHSKDLMRYDGGSHPIGVDYERARLKQGRKMDLISIYEVDRRIRFFNGKVGCGSCHDPYSRLPKKLVMSDEHSKLCFSCHIA